MSDFPKKNYSESIDHPPHYTSGPPCPVCGTTVECITITEQLDFSLGNAIKYIWRAGKKGEAKTIEDLEKAIWYINNEIKLLKKAGVK